MAVLNESVDTINALRASAGLGPIQSTLSGSVFQTSQGPVTSTSSYTPPSQTPQIYVPPPAQLPPPSTTSAAAYSQQTPVPQGGGTSSTSSGIPYVETIQKFLTDHNIALSKTQQRALEYAGIGAAALGLGYTAYKAVTKKTRASSSHRTRTKRTMRRSSRGTKRTRAHLVKGSIAAKRHMAKLRRMRKH